MQGSSYGIVARSGIISPGGRPGNVRAKRDGRSQVENVRVGNYSGSGGEKNCKDVFHFVLVGKEHPNYPIKFVMQSVENVNHFMERVVVKSGYGSSGPLTERQRIWLSRSAGHWSSSSNARAPEFMASFRKVGLAMRLGDGFISSSGIWLGTLVNGVKSGVDLKQSLIGVAVASS